jgi:hypothetical protein
MADWFCYEFDFARRPIPVIYYDEKPVTKRERVQLTRIDNKWDIPPKGADGEYDLGYVKQRFPYIPPETEEETECQDPSPDT